MILSSALRKKMEELSKQHSDTDYEAIRFKQGFTAAVDELTKVPEDVEKKIESHLSDWYDEKFKRTPKDWPDVSDCMEYVANYLLEEIMPSLIEQARRENKEKLQLACEALEFYKNHADCRRSTGIAPCKCSFCKGDDQHRKALAKIRGDENATN